MKKLYLIKSALFFSTLLVQLDVFGQPSNETNVVVVPCKKGVLFIDGVNKGEIEANDASQQTLSFGEHYLQLKTETEKINQTITVDQTSKGIIKLGCVVENKSQGNRLIDKEITLSGGLVGGFEQNIIAFDTDDEIIINCAVLNKKGTASIYLQDYNTGREIYRKEKFENIINDKIKIPLKGVYYFGLYSNALLSKSAKLTIDRVPSKNSNSGFKTAVKIETDTTNVEVLKTVARVYSITNGHGNRTSLKINLPPNTSYWTYWIGVGQEAQGKMKGFASTLSGAGSLLSSNPLVLFGMKLIPALPMLNTTSTVNYQFMDSKNSQSFMNGQAYSYYTFKHAKNISTDYSIINVKYPDLVLSMENESTFAGQDVEVRVVAFIVTSKYVLDE
jgi:hypothetical protein